MLSSRINETERAYLLRRYRDGEFIGPALTDQGEQYDTYLLGNGRLVTLQPDGVWTLIDGGEVLREGATVQEVA